MLKITRDDRASEQRWTLCGQLAGPWVAELSSTWERRHELSNSRNCIVDLSEVTSIDDRGEELLRSMQKDGASFVARGIDMRHILKHLHGKESPPLRRFLAHLNRDRTCL